MALSCYSSSNWGDLEHLNSDFNFSMFSEPQADQYFPDILGLHSDYQNDLLFSDPYVNIDPIFASQELFFSENYTNSNALYSLVDENEYIDPYPADPKRQKGFEECYGISTSCSNPDENIGNGMVMPSLCNDLGYVPSLFLPEIPPQFGSSFAGHSIPAVFGCGSASGGGGSGMTNGKKVASNGGGTLSAQSIAARQRRRKITEKTQELGKLIPGGQKMNTAEMFQAAYKYIKFLQAQVGVLESVASLDQANGESFHINQELNPLLGSSLIQEKLSSMEKCLVPQRFVQSIAKDTRLQWNTTRALKELKELV